MNKIFKYEELFENINFFDLSNESKKRKFIEDITRECLFDFCFSNTLKYHITYGRSKGINFYSEDLLNLAILHGDLDVSSFITMEKSFKISIFKNSSLQIIDLPSLLYSTGKIEIHLTKDDYKDYFNCISHLKNSLDKELDIVSFHIDDIRDFQHPPDDYLLGHFPEIKVIYE